MLKPKVKVLLKMAIPFPLISYNLLTHDTYGYSCTFPIKFSAKGLSPFSTFVTPLKPIFQISMNKKMKT